MSISSLNLPIRHYAQCIYQYTGRSAFPAEFDRASEFITGLAKNKSIKDIFKYVSRCAGLPFFANESDKKLAPNLPDEVWTLIAKNLLPSDDSDDDWIENIKNFQYACKSFFEIGLTVRNSFFIPFFDFKYKIPCSLDQKINSWFSVSKKVKYEPMWVHLDALTMSPKIKPFDIYKVINFLQYGHKNNRSLPILIELGVLQEDDIKRFEFTEIQIRYLSSLSAFWSILKESPDFTYFTKIPDAYLSNNNYEMIRKACREAGGDVENKNNPIFGNIIKGKIGLYYKNPCSDEEPFIEAISKLGDADVMRALYPYVNVHACNFKGENAIHAAARSGNLPALVFLHEKGLNSQKKNYDGRSPIFLSVANGHIEFTKKLIEYGQSVDVRDKKGNTILMYAAHSGDVLYLNYFFDYMTKLGVPVNAVNHKGENIFHIYFKSNNFKRFVDIVMLFYDIDVDRIKYELYKKRYNKESILFLETMNFIKNVIQKNDILMNEKNKKNISPIDFLEDNFHNKIVKLVKGSFFSNYNLLNFI